MADLETHTSQQKAECHALHDRKSQSRSLPGVVRERGNPQLRLDRLRKSNRASIVLGLLPNSLRLDVTQSEAMLPNSREWRGNTKSRCHSFSFTSRFPARRSSLTHSRSSASSSRFNLKQKVVSDWRTVDLDLPATAATPIHSLWLGNLCLQSIQARRLARTVKL